MYWKWFWNYQSCRRCYDEATVCTKTSQMWIEERAGDIEPRKQILQASGLEFKPKQVVFELPFCIVNYFVLYVMIRIDREYSYLAIFT